MSEITKLHKCLRSLNYTNVWDHLTTQMSEITKLHKCLRSLNYTCLRSLDYKCLRSLNYTNVWDHLITQLVQQQYTHYTMVINYVIDTIQVFLPKYPLTTVRSCFSADKLQIVRGKAEDTIVVRPHLSSF